MYQEALAAAGNDILTQDLQSSESFTNYFSYFKFIKKKKKIKVNSVIGDYETHAL